MSVALLESRIGAAAFALLLVSLAPPACRPPPRSVEPAARSSPAPPPSPPPPPCSGGDRVWLDRREGDLWVLVDAEGRVVGHALAGGAPRPSGAAGLPVLPPIAREGDSILGGEIDLPCRELARAEVRRLRRRLLARNRPETSLDGDLPPSDAPEPDPAADRRGSP